MSRNKIIWIENGETPSSPGSWDVTWPAGSTQNNVSVFADNTGKVLKEVPVNIDDSGNISGILDITAGTQTLASGFSYDSVNDRLSVGGTENEINIGGVTLGSKLSVHAEGNNDLAEVAYERHTDSAAFGANIIYGRARGTHAAPAIVQENDVVGRLLGVGYDGATFQQAAEIRYEIDGTPGAGDMPTRIVFATTPDWANAVATALTLDSSQNATFAGSVNMSGNGISGLLDPTLAQDAATKNYVDSIVNGAVRLQWDWNANTNTPDITGTTITGQAWRVSVAGSTNLGGITTWEVWDLAVKTDTGWLRILNQDVAAVWGNISGTLSNQTDLQNALNAKLNLSGGTITGNLGLEGYLNFTTATGTGLATERWIGADGSNSTYYNVPAGQSHLVGVGNVNQLTVDATGTRVLGVFASGGAGLNANVGATLQGIGTTNATFSLVAENSTGANALLVYDDLNVEVPNGNFTVSNGTASFVDSVGGVYATTVENTSNSILANTQLRVENDINAVANLRINSSTFTGSRWGQTLSNWSEVLSGAVTGMAVGTTTSAPLILGTNSVAGITIDTSQNIGIGTSVNINKKLEVVGDYRDTLGVYRNFDASASAAAQAIEIGALDGTTKTVWGEVSVTCNFTGADNTAQMGLSVLNTSGVMSERVTILSGGNVGFNIINPQKNLSINGGNGSTEVQLVNAATGGGASDGMSFRVELDGGSGGLWAYGNQDLTFSVSNGTELMRLDASSGNMGIGTPTPDANLDGVTGISIVDTTSAGVSIGTPTRNYMMYTSGNNFFIYDGTSNLERIQLNDSGNLRFFAYGAGTLVTDANGNVTASSDKNLKENIKLFNHGLADVIGVDPKIYNWTEESGLDTENEYSGFIAQDLEHIVWAVYWEEGKKTVSDRALIATLWNAVKELKKEIDVLKN